MIAVALHMFNKICQCFHTFRMTAVKLLHLIFAFSSDRKACLTFLKQEMLQVLVLTLEYSLLSRLKGAKQVSKNNYTASR